MKGSTLRSFSALAVLLAATSASEPPAEPHFRIVEYKQLSAPVDYPGNTILVCSDRPSFYLPLVREFAGQIGRSMEVLDGAGETADPSRSDITLAFLGTPGNPTALSCLERYPALKAGVNRMVAEDDAMDGRPPLPPEVLANFRFPVGKSSCRSSYEYQDGKLARFVGLAFRGADCTDDVVPSLFSYTRIGRPRGWDPKPDPWQ